MKTRDKVVIGWIDPGHVDAMFCWSIADVIRRRGDRIDRLIRSEGSLVSRQRNEIVAGFLDSPCEWLLMIDSDERFSVDDFDKLVSAAHADDRPIVAGMYFAAWPGGPDIYPEPVPLIFRRIGDSSRFAPVRDYPPDAVIPVDSAGTGCLLVHRAVFEAIRDARANEHTGSDWCWFMDMPVNGDWFGEDMYFCRSAQLLGFPIVAHTGVQIGHRKRYWLDRRHHERFQLLTGVRDDADRAPA